jgi:hypothetical protein
MELHLRPVAHTGAGMEHPSSLVAHCADGTELHSSLDNQ